MLEASSAARSFASLSSYGICNSALRKRLMDDDGQTGTTIANDTKKDAEVDDGGRSPQGRSGE